MATVLIILGYIIVGVIEIIPMYKKGQNKELILYSVLFLSAFTLSVLLSLGIKIPSPAKSIENAVKMIIGG